MDVIHITKMEGWSLLTSVLFVWSRNQSTFVKGQICWYDELIVHQKVTKANKNDIEKEKRSTSNMIFADK